MEDTELITSPMLEPILKPGLYNPDAPATKEDIARLDEKVTFMIRTFENLGTTFEGAVGEFLNGPMGKLFGKLAGGSNGRSNSST